MLDYLDTFVHEYTTSKAGKEFPSLRMTTDVLLNLIAQLKSIEVGDLSELESLPEAFGEISIKLAEATKNGEVFNSRELGLFTDKKETVKPASEPVETLKPLKISSKVDRDWLRKCGISYK
jgi:hypothetical protein